MNIVYFMELSMKKRKTNSFQFQCTHYKKCGSLSMCTMHYIAETEHWKRSNTMHLFSQSDTCITQMHSPLFQLRCLYGAFKIERKIYFTTSESLIMLKLRLRLKFQETLSIKFTATKKPVIIILNNPPKTLNSPPKKLIKSSGYNEEICTELIKPYVFFHFFHQKI